jgi:hypothetical protein
VTAPPPTIRNVTAVRLGLGWATPADSRIANAWLVPVYLFQLDDGETIPVLAIVDRYLTGPTPATTATTRVTRSLPQPVPATAPGEVQPSTPSTS